VVPSDSETKTEPANAPNQRALFRRMTENFSGVYLTMLSIIQGVALTDLAGVAFSSHADFGIVQWVEVATMLWSVIYIWNHFMGDSLMAQWIPDLEDAVLLFGTGVLEIIANHAIVWGIPAWLATGAVMLFLWTIGNFYIRAQQERVVRDPVLMEMLRNRMRPLFIETLGGAVVLSILALASRSPMLALAGVAIASIINIVIGVTSTRFWKIVRAYAYTGKAP
jgi:hypothetical protein